MITFSPLNAKYKLYDFFTLNETYINYKKIFLDTTYYIPETLNETFKPAKDLNEQAEIDAKTIIIKLIKDYINQKKYPINYDYKNNVELITDIRQKYLSYDSYKDFSDNIFVSEREIINEVAKGNLEVISEKNFKEYLDLVFLEEEYFINATKKKYKEKTILKIMRCFENFHTHSSKYIDSSSALTLNISSDAKNIQYLNSSSNTKFGLDASINGTGSYGRDFPGILKAISTVFNVEGKIVSIFSFLMKLIEKLNLNHSFDNIEGYFLNNLEEKTNIVTIYNLSLKLKNNDNLFTKEEKNLIDLYSIIIKKEDKNKLSKVSQILWYDGEEFLNLIPLPSVKVMSSLPVLKEKISKGYKQLKEQEYKQNLEELKLNETSNKSKIKEVTNQINNIEKEYPKGISKKVKSVASNAQNVSDYLSLKGGYLERFYSYKYVKPQSNFHERSFYKFDSMFLSKKIQNNKLSNNVKIIEDKELFYSLPNSVTKRLYKSICLEIADKIIKELNYFKKEFILNKSKYDDLKDKQEILNVENTELVLFQKYLLNIATEDEKRELTNILIFKYEKINDLNEDLKNQIKENIWIKL